VKRGLHEPPLLAVDLAIGGEQPIAKESLQVSAVTKIGLYEIARVFHQKVAYMLWTEKRHHRFTSQAQMRHTPKSLLCPSHKRERITLKL